MDRTEKALMNTGMNILFQIGENRCLSRVNPWSDSVIRSFSSQTNKNAKAASPPPSGRASISRPS